MNDQKQEAVVTLVSEPKPSMLAQWRREYINALIQENGYLRAAVAAEREKLAQAFDLNSHKAE